MADSFVEKRYKKWSSFTTLVGSRGLHVYQKSAWKKPRKDELLSFKKEIDPVALRFDPHSITFTRKSIEYLVPVTVGHISLEISRHVYYFLMVDGSKSIPCKMRRIFDPERRFRNRNTGDI